MSAEARTAALITGREQALTAAERLAAAWIRPGEDRDRDRRLPVDELAALAGSGLLGISVPAKHGGAGLPPSAVAEVFATLATGDLALAQIAQNHFDFVDVLRWAEDSFRDRLFAEVLAGARFGNALAERGSQGLRVIRTRLSVGPGGLRLDGLKQFATGALTADWIPALALDSAEEARVVYVERHAPGVDVREDWDAFGQRATFSGTVAFTDVAIRPEQVVERGRGNRELALALLAGNQLIHAALEYGAARGSFEARRARTGEPPVHLRRALDRARLAVARASRLVDDAATRERPDRERAVRALVAVDAAKSITYRVGPLLGREVLGEADAAAVLRDGGLDRHWRNSRVHSLHDPARQRERGLGAHLLAGDPPAFAAHLLAPARDGGVGDPSLKYII
jgi:alkylation response protein AidB-like acyl-CoA dehydrogenase